jgi:AhpD family alkylhydroperoxidase
MSDAPRIPLVAPGTRPELREIERAILEHRGRISPLYQALLNSPPVAAGWETFLTAVRSGTRVPAGIRELIILRVAVLNRAAFEFDAHAPLARQAGISEAKIDAVRTAAPSHYDDPFEADERLALALTDALTRDVDVADDLFDRLRARFDARDIVEMVTIVAAYNMVSRFLVALRIGHR